MQQGVLGGDPYARQVLDGKHQHADPIEQLQGGAVAGGDVGHRVGHSGDDVGHHEHDQEPIDGARGRLPAAPVLEDLEDAPARALAVSLLLLCRHRIDPVP